MSMKDAGILDGDLVAVHRTAEVRNRQIVVARLENEVTVKRYRQQGSVVWLMPENTEFEPIRVDLQHEPLLIEGVVVGVLRRGSLAAGFGLAGCAGRLAVTDVVVLEIADQLGRVLLFHAPLQAPPGRLAALGRAPLGDFHVLDDAIDIETLVIDALVALVVGVELFALLASSHGGIPLRVGQPFGAENKSIRARMQWCRFTFLRCRFTFPSSNE